MQIAHKDHNITVQIYFMTVITHVIALEAGQSSQGTSKGGGGGRMERDLISDIRPLKNQISDIRPPKKNQISDIRPPKKSIIRYHTP